MLRIKALLIDFVFVILIALPAYIGFNGYRNVSEYNSEILSYFDLFVFIGFVVIALIIKKFTEYFLSGHGTIGMRINSLKFVDKKGGSSFKKLLIRDFLIITFLSASFFYESYNFLGLTIIFILPLVKNEFNHLDLVIENVIGIHCVSSDSTVLNGL